MLTFFPILSVLSSTVTLIDIVKCFFFACFCAQIEPCEVKLEVEKIHQDVTLPVSIIYKDDDMLAHPSVS